MPLPRSWYPRLASLEEAVALYASQDEWGPWPPPGTHLLPIATPEYWALVVEDNYGSAPDDDRLYATTLGEFVLGVPDWALAILSRVATIWAGPIAALGAVLDQWPVVWRATEGRTMRWLKTTIRGEMGGGVEQFQMGLNLGVPGSDPELDEAECLALAEQLAGIWDTALDFGSPVGLAGCCASDIKFNELGVTQCTQTDATSSDGTGGNLSQAFETQWFAYPTGTKPGGVDAGVSMPYEVSCAVTLQTDHRGPSGRGRVYCPPFSVGSMLANGVFNTVYSTGAAKTWGKYLEEIKAQTPYVGVIVSRRRIILHEIVAVNVGQVPDSQRRRRRSQDEARIDVWAAV